MAMRSIVPRAGLYGVMNNLRSSASYIRHLSDGKGRVLSEEERAQETVYIKKMEKEMQEKKKKKAEQDRAAKEESDKKAAEDAKK